MIDRLNLLRNVGTFESVSSGSQFALGRLTLVYAENGRGKTTITAILRSAGTGDPIPIAERKRLAAQHPPHVIIQSSGGPPLIFENGVWNRHLPDLRVFDDLFVDQNIYSGLVVAPGHRQNLHGLILGAHGIALNSRLQQLVSQIEEHNRALRRHAEAIPATARGELSVEDFCTLPPRPDIDGDIERAERGLAAAHERENIRNALPFEPLRLPSFDIGVIEVLLRRDLPALEVTAARQVQEHLIQCGQGAEAWIAEGMKRFVETAKGKCPFCAQTLDNSPLICAYQSFFSSAYRELNQAASRAVAGVEDAHGGDAVSVFDRAVGRLREARQFWTRFCEVPEVKIDDAAIRATWRAAREAIAARLREKHLAPLASTTLSQEARDAVAAYQARSIEVAAISRGFQETNGAIALVKEKVASANLTALAADLERLRAVQARYGSGVASLCDAFLAEKANKLATEKLRDQAKAALEQYQTAAFPGYQTAINVYLERFNAGFRLDQIVAASTRGGPTCTYDILINDIAVPVTAGDAPSGPSFRNTLSSGDRNTLALAFFFASLDQDLGLATRMVIIDDPVSSLDDHRSLSTVQEIRRLIQRVSQVIVLSHTKGFLCRLWEGADRTSRAALQVTRDGTGSTNPRVGCQPGLRDRTRSTRRPSSPTS